MTEQDAITLISRLSNSIRIKRVPRSGKKVRDTPASTESSHAKSPR